MYDGVHLYGPFGRKAYTNSILHILESQNMTLKPKISEHKMVHEVICPSTNKAPFASTDIRLKVNKSTIKAIPEVVKHKDIIGNKISDSNLPYVNEVAEKFDNNFPNSDKVCPPTVFRKKETKFNCASTNDIYSKRMKVFLKKYERPPPNLTITRTLQKEKKYDMNAWSDKHWEETLRIRNEITPTIPTGENKDNNQCERGPKEYLSGPNVENNFLKGITHKKIIDRDNPV